MTIKEIAFQMDEARHKMWELSSFAFVLDTAISEGANDCRGYEGAAYVLSSMARDLEQEMNRLTEAIFVHMKAGQGG